MLYRLNLYIVIASVFCSCSLYGQKNNGTQLSELSCADFKKQIWNYETHSANFVFQGKKHAIIHFYSANGHSKAIAPILAEIQKEYKNRIDVYKVNSDKETELVQLFKIQNFPTLLFIPQKGDPQSYVGFKTKNEIVRLIETTFGK